MNGPEPPHTWPEHKNSYCRNERQPNKRSKFPSEDPSAAVAKEASELSLVGGNEIVDKRTQDWTALSNQWKERGKLIHPPRNDSHLGQKAWGPVLRNSLVGQSKHPWIQYVGRSKAPQLLAISQARGAINSYQRTWGRNIHQPKVRLACYCALWIGFKLVTQWALIVLNIARATAGSAWISDIIVTSHDFVIS